MPKDINYIYSFIYKYIKLRSYFNRFTSKYFCIHYQCMLSLTVVLIFVWESNLYLIKKCNL